MKILATVNLSKGFTPWVQMTKDLTPEMEKAGIKIVWAGTNPDENKVFVVIEMPDICGLIGEIIRSIIWILFLFQRYILIHCS